MIEVNNSLSRLRGDARYLKLDCSNDPLTADLQLTEDLLLLDSKKVLFGTGNDASIYYNGTNMVFNSREVGTGDFNFSGGNVKIGTNSSNALVNIAGDMFFDGNRIIGINTSDGSDTGLLGISGASALSTGRGSYVVFYGADHATAPGNVVWSVAGTGKFVLDSANDANPVLELTYDGQMKLYGDNYKLLLGAAQDASIYYDGTNLCINPKEVGTGYLDVQGRLNLPAGLYNNLSLTMGDDNSGFYGGANTIDCVINGAREATYQANALTFAGNDIKMRYTAAANIIGQNGGQGDYISMSRSSKVMSLLSDIIIGAAGAGIDYTLTFDGETNDGIIKWMEDEDYFQFGDDIMMLGGENIVLDTTTGTKIGTATSQLLGFYNATPVDQPATVSDAATQDITGTDTVDKTKVTADLTSCKNAINAIIDRLQELGLIA